MKAIIHILQAIIAIHIITLFMLAADSIQTSEGRWIIYSIAIAAGVSLWTYATHSLWTMLGGSIKQTPEPIKTIYLKENTKDLR